MPFTHEFSYQSTPKINPELSGSWQEIDT